MVHLPVVYGEWKMVGSLWHFLVDNRKGGRMFFLRDGCTHDELLQMARDDFELEEKSLVELNYSLPESMLKEMATDTPPMRVTNDRHVHGLIELSRTHVVRLCVSGPLKNGTGNNDGVDGHAEENCDQEAKEGANEDAWKNANEGEEGKVKDANIDQVNSDNEDYSKFGKVNEGEEGKVKDENIDEVSSDDEDYSKFGKVKDEDSDVDDMRFTVENVKAQTYGEEISVSKSYASKAELIAELHLTAVLSKFSFRVYKSTTTLFVARCKVKECGWKLRASVKNVPNTFWVTKYKNVHTCSVADRLAHRKHTTPKYVGRLFIEQVGIIDGITPQHIKDSMKKRFGLRLDYTTAYRALLHAQVLVRGSAEDGYDNLPEYLHLIKKANPGTFTGLELDEHNRFKYLFIAFGASIFGFQYLRRVIVVDGCHLTGKYGGVLLVAVAQDGNFQIFPLAFAVVDSENNDSWEWFFTKLRECFSDQYPLVIVSDRHSSIEYACQKVLPWVTRGICYYHLQQNIIQKFGGRQLMYLVKGAAYAFTLTDFNRYMTQLRLANPALADYMEAADVKLWSRVHFTGDRYNIKTSNIAESINSALKVARGFPISFLLEFIREKLGRWFCKRREDALSLTTQHSRGVEYLLAVRGHQAETMPVERIDEWRFHVKGGRGRDCVVDLENRRCECGVFQIEKIPCSHAIAAAIEGNVHVSTIVCSSYQKDYLHAAYLRNIFPKSDAVEKIEKIPCLPPVVKSQPGRKKKSRWQTWLEISMKKGYKPRKAHKQYSCSKCRQPGHTRDKCVS